MSLTLDNLSIGYGNRLVANNLHAVAEAGSLICLLGRNGSGKSTLLRTLAGLQAALGGEIHYPAPETAYSVHRVTTPTICSGKNHTVQLSKTLALCLTERESLEETRVRQIVSLGRYPHTSFMGKLTERDNQIVTDAMQRVGILHKADAYFNCLSDGEKQCVLIAKALAQQTPVILLDEPTAHLDLPNRIRIMSMLKQLAKEQHKIVIISTHELDIALQTADNLWLMSPEQLICLSPTSSNLSSLRAFLFEFFELENFVPQMGSL